MKTAVLKALCSSVSKNKVRTICEKAELTELETNIVLEHYCSPNDLAEKIANDLNISLDQLNKRKEQVAMKIESFIADNLSYFNYIEANNFVKILLKIKKEI